MAGDANVLVAAGAAVEGIVAVLGNAGDTRVIGFTLVIGAMIAVIERTGGVRGFVGWLTRRRWVTSARRAEWLAWGTGIVIFIESNLTLLVAGAVSRPLFDRLRISRERLAYLIDSTSAPVCILIPLNAWGAFNLGLLNGTALENPLGTFIGAIPFNFYSILAVVLAAVVIARGWNFGPMAKAQARTRNGQLLWPNAAPMVDPSLLGSTDDAETSEAGPSFMLVPIAVLVAMVPVALYVTGEGNLAEGSGSTAVLWAVLTGLTAAWLMAMIRQRRGIDELMDTSLKGAGGLLPVAVILLLALALGDVTDTLGTGAYLSQVVSDNVPLLALPALVFLVSGFTAFSIGSSWGTFAIMIPVAMPIALTLGIDPALLLGAVLSGAVFGDHASPISDTTVVASMAAATDHIDHVRTQLPYALLAGGMALVLYLGMGLSL
ncbi:MAG: C4-dicarboxylate ABC transporter [Gammaproteobacteria bacterium]|nr:C4-dicarboxylate ABC transporter [Gammaproteobacteria bacterium]